MKILSEEVKKQLKEFFQNLKNECNLLLIYRENDNLLKEIISLLQELTSVSPKITFEKINLLNAPKEILPKKIELTPAILIGKKGKLKRNVIFYGFPGGLEFTTFVKAIEAIANEETNLEKEMIDQVESIDKKVNIKVFTTHSCPHCPRAALTAIYLSIINSNIVTEVIEASQFIDYSEKYNVFAVPKVVINDKVSFEGALPARIFLRKIQEAL